MVKIKIVGLLVVLCMAGSSLSAQVYELYVSDAGNFNNPPWKILRFDGNGQNPTVFINTNLNWPQDIYFPENTGTVLISNLGTNKITRYDAATGMYQNDFATGIIGPTRMKLGADSLLYVLQWNGNGKVKRYMLNGTYVDDFTAVGVPQSIGLDWDAAGNLYVSSYSSALVRKFSPTGADLGLFISSNLSGPTNIWFDANGDLLVTDYNSTSVKRFDSNGNFLGNFITGLSNAEGVAFFPNGNILIGNGATHSVKMFDANGMYLSEFVPSGSGNLLTPNALVLRDVSAMGLPEQPHRAQHILIPSAGSRFALHPGLDGRIREIRLLSASGLQVNPGDCLNAGWVDAEALPNGVYLVTARLTNDAVLNQRIVVMH